MSDLRYSTGYYERLENDSARSAARVVPRIVEWFAPKSMVDVGCGSGSWTSAFKQAGVPSVMGIDGFHVRQDQLLIEPAEFQRHDLSRPLQLDRRFDLALCVEVAEHLPPARAAGLVEDLCRLSEVVVFSAAVPGQGGTHHVNEQWPGYWIRHFAGNGFRALDCLRPAFWEDREVAWRDQQNLFAFVKESRVKDFPAAVEQCGHAMPVDLVHPRAYMAAALPREMSPRMLAEVARALPHFVPKILRHLKGGSPSNSRKPPGA